MLEGVRAAEQQVQARGRRDADDQENELDDRPLNVAGGVREGRVGQEGVHEAFAPVAAFAVVATHGSDLRRGQREERRDQEREDREDGARVCADKADGTDEEEQRLRNTAHDGTQPIARAQVGHQSASRDDRDG